MNNDLKLMTAFALAYLADNLSTSGITEGEIEKLYILLRPIASEVKDFQDTLDPEDTPRLVVDQFIQAYNNLKVAVEEYEALEREEY